MKLTDAEKNEAAAMDAWLAAIGTDGEAAALKALTDAQAVVAAADAAAKAERTARLRAIAEDMFDDAHGNK
jgi:hypothetical protein